LYLQNKTILILKNSLSSLAEIKIQLSDKLGRIMTSQQQVSCYDDEQKPKKT